MFRAEDKISIGEMKVEKFNIIVLLIETNCVQFSKYFTCKMKESIQS